MSAKIGEELYYRGDRQLLSCSGGFLWLASQLSCIDCSTLGPWLYLPNSYKFRQSFQAMCLIVLQDNFILTTQKQFTKLAKLIKITGINQYFGMCIGKLTFHCMVKIKM